MRRTIGCINRFDGGSTAHEAIYCSSCDAGAYSLCIIRNANPAECRFGNIDDEKQVSAYPVQKETRAPFVEEDWNLDTMEPKSGKYPGQTATRRTS